MRKSHHYARNSLCSNPFPTPLKPDEAPLPHPRYPQRPLFQVHPRAQARRQPSFLAPCVPSKVQHCKWERNGGHGGEVRGEKGGKMKEKTKRESSPTYPDPVQFRSQPSSILHFPAHLRIHSSVYSQCGACLLEISGTKCDWCSSYALLSQSSLRR